MIEHPPTLAVIAFEDETLAWTSALFVRRRVAKPVVGVEIASVVPRTSRSSRSDAI